VTREEVLSAVGTHLFAEWGGFVVARDARLVRRAAGGIWLISVVIPASTGDVFVVDLEVDEHGAMANPLDVDKILEAARRPIETPAVGDDPFASPDSELSGLLGDLGADEEEEAPPSTAALDDKALYARAQLLVGKGDNESLEKARLIMPRLLQAPDRRGAVLVWMAVVERKLGNPALAVQHLEAAAREFADRFDLVTLEKLSSLSVEIMGPESFQGSPIRRLLDDSRERMRPIGTIYECPQLYGVGRDNEDWLGDHKVLHKLEQGKALVREGEPSRTVFVIKSGLVGVWLQNGDGKTSRLVRCCFPGWLLGESSVLVDDDPRCTATLRAERPSEVWAIEASSLKKFMKENEDLRHRIAATKQLHGIDSFFSMHETLSQLEVLVRDELLGCIQKIEHVDADTVIIAADETPKVACLVTKGELVVHDGKPGKKPPIATVGVDRFVGVRDAMHAISPATTVVAKAGSTLALLSADLLRKIAEKSPEHVIAVLERLG